MGINNLDFGFNTEGLKTIKTNLANTAQTIRNTCKPLLDSIENTQNTMKRIGGFNLDMGGLLRFNIKLLFGGEVSE